MWPPVRNVAAPAIMRTAAGEHHAAFPQPVYGLAGRYGKQEGHDGKGRGQRSEPGRRHVELDRAVGGGRTQNVGGGLHENRVAQHGGHLGMNAETTSHQVLWGRRCVGDLSVTGQLECVGAGEPAGRHRAKAAADVLVHECARSLGVP